MSMEGSWEILEQYGFLFTCVSVVSFTIGSIIFSLIFIFFTGFLKKGSQGNMSYEQQIWALENRLDSAFKRINDLKKILTDINDKVDDLQNNLSSKHENNQTSYHDDTNPVSQKLLSHIVEDLGKEISNSNNIPKTIELKNPTKQIKETTAFSSESTSYSEDFLAEFNTLFTSKDSEKKSAFIINLQCSFFQITNFRRKGLEKPSLSRIDVPEKCHFLGFKQNNGTTALVPNFDISASLKNLTSDQGRNSDPWFKGIFKYQKGDRFWVHKPALFEQGEITQTGILELPII